MAAPEKKNSTPKESKPTLDHYMHSSGYFSIDRKNFFEIYETLGIKELFIYMLLLSHRNYRSGKCFPSIKTLTKETQLSKPTVIKLLNNLKKAGYIEIDLGRSHLASSYAFPKEVGSISSGSDSEEKEDLLSGFAEEEAETKAQQSQKEKTAAQKEKTATQSQKEKTAPEKLTLAPETKKSIKQKKSSQSEVPDDDEFAGFDF